MSPKLFAVAAFAVSAGCNPSASPAPPGSSGEAGGASLVGTTVGTCQTQVVDAGVDATIDWSGLTTDPDGNPLTPPDHPGEFSGDQLMFTLTAAQALAKCDDRGVFYDDEDLAQALFLDPRDGGRYFGEYLPDGGATWVTAQDIPGWDRDWILGLLLLPTEGAGVTTVSFNGGDWIPQ